MVVVMQTTNLDGESNLKVRSALSQTKTMANELQLSASKIVCICANPNEHIYVFDSQLKLSPDAPNVLALSASQLLLQATHVRNTDWLYGLVVYTGT
jgi:phospholipid-transporting ATPase